VRTRRVLIVGLVSICVAAVTITVLGSRPAVCTSCHVVNQANESQGLRSPHAALGCYECHLADGPPSLPAFKSAELFRMYPTALFGEPEDPPVPGSVGYGPCIRCHSGTPWSGTTEARGLKIKHSSCAVGSCLRCHSSAGHEAREAIRGPYMSDCIACHERREVALACDTCHAEGYDRAGRLATSFKATHGKDWRVSHGVGNLTECRQCHDEDDCIRCHRMPIPHKAGFGIEHGELAVSNAAACTPCHRNDFCRGCHGIVMPHPSGFLTQHPRKASGIDDPVCLRCHTKQGCVDCHVAHVHPGGTKPSQIASPASESPDALGGDHQ